MSNERIDEIINTKNTLEIPQVTQSTQQHTISQQDQQQTIPQQEQQRISQQQTISQQEQQRISQQQTICQRDQQQAISQQDQQQTIHQQEQQQQTIPQSQIQEQTIIDQQVILPPPYHERASLGEAVVLTTNNLRTQNYTRTPPPPYNPQSVLYVYPKDDYRRITPRNKLNKWVYVVLATCIGSLLLGIMKFILIYQNKAFYGH